jgi:hypothetical protein
MSALDQLRKRTRNKEAKLRRQKEEIEGKERKL